ncbi:MAG: single-stranded-DNA-specific exonuclease RecJ [Lachnospiraceae bacterium]|nr:single-stranded-DNA-specific exonuclease RecJ [Lachnospiraceae bacterium]
MEKWIVESKRADFNALSKRFGISPVLARIIRNRDVVGEEAMERFLYGSLKDIPDGRAFRDLNKAADILEEKIGGGAKVRIIGDYDIDGVCATYILLKGLSLLGLSCSYDIPDRITDGYGMNVRMVEDALKDGVDTLITCDNGISAAVPVHLAKEHGMTVIVTDHHEVPKDEDGQDRLPEADAVVDGKRQDCPYPFKDVCGAVTALRLVQELYRRKDLPDAAWDPLLEFAAMATVGDVMPLKEENRIYVREGLSRIHHTKNLGLSCLMEACGLQPNTVNTYHLGFVIGPCLNAGGRLKTAQLALELFLTNDLEKARVLALELKSLNDERKGMTADGLEDAVKHLEAEGRETDPVLVVHLPDCHESLAGIIAGRLRERYNRPSFVLTGSGETVKGSGRSIPAYSMFEKLCGCEDLLLKFGGHPMAAGLSLQAENVDAFRERLCRESGLTDADFVPEVRIDVPMPIDYISEGLIQQFELLEPCGTGNPRPLFAEAHFQVMAAHVIGKNHNVLKMTVRNGNGCRIEAIFFGDIPTFRKFVETEFGAPEAERMFAGLPNGVDLAFAYYPEINEFNGRRSLQIVVSHYCRIRS